MAEITESVTLTPDANWGILPMLPIKNTVDASEEAITITLPSPSEVVGGQTQLAFDVTDVTETVTLDGADGITFNGSASLELEVVGTYYVTVGSATNWLVTSQYIPTAP